MKNGRIIDPVNGFDQIGTVWIDGGLILCVEAENAQIINGKRPPGWDAGSFLEINARGKWVVPGFVDLHVHFRDPGFEYKEDISSGCMAAKAGGFTKVCCMPNTFPVVDNADTVNYIKDKAKDIPGIEIFVVGAVTKGQDGKTLSDMEDMAKAGICAISEDGKTVQNSALMRSAMMQARRLGLPFFSHAEDESLGALALSEDIIVARDILLAKDTGCRTHFCHVSTAGSVELIRKAKGEGLFVTAEATPHHFSLDESCINCDGNKKMNPPLRAKKDVEAIKIGLSDGTIDAIATDHAPHAPSEKNCDFENALNGVIGLETSFAISYTELVKSGILSPIQLIEKMSTAPAKILNIPAATISADSPADILIVDAEHEYEISETDFASKSVNSPFVGQKVFGKPYHIEKFLSGEIFTPK